MWNVQARPSVGGEERDSRWVDWPRKALLQTPVNAFLSPMDDQHPAPTNPLQVRDPRDPADLSSIHLESEERPIPAGCASLAIEASVALVLLSIWVRHMYLATVLLHILLGSQTSPIRGQLQAAGRPRYHSACHIENGLHCHGELSAEKSPHASSF